MSTRFGKCQHCTGHSRLTANGKLARHKRLRGASEFGAGKVWCEGSGIAPRGTTPAPDAHEGERGEG